MHPLCYGNKAEWGSSGGNVDFITPDVKDRLMHEHVEFKNLMEAHRAADERLTLLMNKSALTSKDSLEAEELKKAKLRAKDRLYKRVQDFKKAKNQ
jgi:uncharacterized protein YdcH (DUF465 family)